MSRKPSSSRRHIAIRPSTIITLSRVYLNIDSFRHLSAPQFSMKRAKRRTMYSLHVRNRIYPVIRYPRLGKIHSPISMQIVPRSGPPVARRTFNRPSCPGHHSRRSRSYEFAAAIFTHSGTITRAERARIARSRFGPGRGSTHESRDQRSSILIGRDRSAFPLRRRAAPRGTGDAIVRTRTRAT